jgi:hypothetical protein
MCLTRFGKPKKKSGFGWKVVWKTQDPEVFRSYYQGFYTGRETGGTMCSVLPNLNAACGQLVIVQSDTTYKLNIPYRVEHDRKARVDYISKIFYPAGVHLYKRKRDATFLESAVNGIVIKKFKYNDAVACDDDTIVAMEVTLIKGGRGK